MILEIEYDENDNLCNLSEFILDLEPQNRTVKILFECIIDKKRLLKAIDQNKEIPKDRYIKKYLHEYLLKRIFIFENYDDLLTKNRTNLIKKDIKDVKKLIDFDVIHAKRSVTSSEEKSNKKKFYHR